MFKICFRASRGLFALLAPETDMVTIWGAGKIFQGRRLLENSTPCALRADYARSLGSLSQQNQWYSIVLADPIKFHRFLFLQMYSCCFSKDPYAHLPASQRSPYFQSEVSSGAQSFGSFHGHSVHNERKFNQK